MPKQKAGKYYLLAGLMLLVATPLMVSAGFLIAEPYEHPFDLNCIKMILLSFIFLMVIWSLYARIAKLPERASKVFLPIVVVFCYFMCLWIIYYGIFGSDLWRNNGFTFINDQVVPFYMFTFPYFLLHLFLTTYLEIPMSFPFVIAIISLLISAIIVIVRKISGKMIVFDRKALVYIAIFVCLSGIACFQVLAS